MKNFVNAINSKLPEGLSYGDLSNNEKATIKGMYMVCSHTEEFKYPKIGGFPTATQKAQSRIVTEAMVEIKDFIVDIACEYIISVKKGKDEVSDNR